MKKLIYLLISVVVIYILSGCEIGKNMINTPTKQVEKLFSNYQTLDSEVLKDLDNVVALYPDFTTDQRNKYRDLMKKHYQDMKYEIKDERIDGDSATVTVLIDVKDYSKAKTAASLYLQNNPLEFNENNEYSSTIYNNYLLEQLSKTTDRIKYTLDLSLKKVNDKWELEPLTATDKDKIHGNYIS